MVWSDFSIVIILSLSYHPGADKTIEREYSSWIIHTSVNRNES